MSDYNDERRKRPIDNLSHLGDEEGDGGESSGFSGQGGALEFHDFVFVQGERKLTGAEEKQLLAQHNVANSGLVEKQKDLRDKRHDKKEGKALGNQWGMGAGAEKAANFLKHPILGEAPEFDGIDPQVNLDPTINEAETNSEKKQELVLQHQLRLGLQNQPRNTPKPSPY